MATSVGSLFASLTLQSDQFVQGTRQASAAAQTMSGSITKSFGHIAKTVTEAFGVYRLEEFFLESIKSAFEFAGSLEAVSKQLGLTTSQYQELNVVAIKNGVTMESLTTGLRKLQAEIGQAQMGSEKWVKLFKDIGIKPEVLKSTKDWATLLPSIAKGLENAGSSTKTAGQAQLILGKQYAAFLPILQDVAKGWDVMAAEANQAGMLTEEQAEKAHQAEAAINLLSYSFKVRLGEAMSDVLPIIQEVTFALGDMLKNTMTDIRLLESIPDRVKLAYDKARSYKLGSVLMGQGLNNSDADEAVRKDRLNILFDNALPLEYDTPKSPSPGPNDMDLSTHHKPHKARGGSKSDPAGDLLTKLRHDVAAAKEKLGIDPNDARALHEFDTQQQIFVNLQQAGKKATQAQKDAIADLTRQLSDTEALQKWNDEMRKLGDNAQYAADTMGMDEYQKARFDIMAEDKKHPVARTSHADADGNIIVDGGLSPEAKADMDKVAAQQHAAALQLVKDLQDEDRQLTMTAKEQEVYNNLKKLGADATEEDRKATIKATEAKFDHAKALETIREAADKIGDIGVNMLDGLIHGTETWGNIFKKAIMDIGDLMLQELVFKPMKAMIASGIERLLISLVGGGGSPWAVSLGSATPVASANVNWSNILSGLPTMGHALGGPADAGHPYWVGEKGPELFVPSSGGNIIPNNRSGGGQSVTINVDARGSTNPAETQALVQQGILAALPLIRQDASAFTMRKLGRPTI